MTTKQEILQACIEHQKKVATTAKIAMDEQQKQANEYGPPKDRYDAFRNQLLRKRDFHAGQYQQALDELKILERINPEYVSTKVEFGAVVITPIHKLFISIGIGKFLVEGIEYFAISPRVPIFKAIEGLQKGQRFMFNGRQFELLDVF